MIPIRKKEDWDGVLVKSNHEAQRAVETFLNSDEWKAILAATRQPPARRRIQLDLPDSLGGSLELDAEQFRALGQWLNSRSLVTLKSHECMVAIESIDRSASPAEVKRGISLF